VFACQHGCASTVPLKSSPSILTSYSGCALRKEGTKESYFMFERDRGEMPVIRYKDKEQTYYAKKMLIYHEANRKGVHTRDLGIPHFRVATVTTTADRVEQMIAAQREITNGKGPTCSCSRTTRHSLPAIHSISSG
jgi:hypothetical protein